MKKRNRKGFTLIELLVVIAIIAILAAAIIANTSSARIQARDARRLQDLNQIATAAAMYYSKNNAYPANIAAMVTDGELSVEPKDPKDNSSYLWGTQPCTYNGSTVMVVAATLEADSATAAKDPGATICGVACGTSMVYCIVR